MNSESTNFDRAKMTERVGKLFAKAASTASEEEATALLERAFALSAKYGIDEALARSGGDVDAAEITTVTIDITGRYQPDQISLIASIATALHCKVITSQAGQIRKCMVVGARRHTDRVTMLAGFLTGIMLTRAAKARSPHPAISTVAHRKSFMRICRSQSSVDVDRRADLRTRTAPAASLVSFVSSVTADGTRRPRHGRTLTRCI